MSLVKTKSFPMPPINVDEAVMCLDYIDHDCEILVNSPGCFGLLACLLTLPYIDQLIVCCREHLCRCVVGSMPPKRRVYNGCLFFTPFGVCVDVDAFTVCILPNLFDTASVPIRTFRFPVMVRYELGTGTGGIGHSVRAEAFEKIA